MIKAAVIGCGYWGPNIVRVLYEDSKWDLKYCCDLDAQKLDRIATLHSGIAITRDSDKIFTDPEIQAVFIVTPLNSHYPLARQSILAKKPTFIEKPFVSKVAEAEELIQLAHQNNVPLMVGHIFEYSPAVIKIKELLDKQELGTIHYISATRVNLGIHRKDESVIWDLASHDFGTIFYWLGEEPISVQAVGKGSVIKDTPDIAFITFRFPSDILVNIQVSWLAPSKLRNTVIVGSQKMVIYDDTDPSQKIKIFDKGISAMEHTTFGEFQLSYRTGDIIVPILSNIEPLRVEINHFYECVKKNEQPKTNGKVGLRVIKYLELAERSLQNNGEVIAVNH
ncbi:MAG: Gfo/Idh/MocA family oxidoreductase [Candidatus Stahlbacteria bacterium]|nr:Gfo/Idh/MocA family oxidoreductase [Candidatus Stahlbacteria bacterium]